MRVHVLRLIYQVQGVNVNAKTPMKSNYLNSTINKSEDIAS